MTVVKWIIVIPFFFPSAVLANDFPTVDRVEYVLRCMDAHGGQTVETLFQCSCRLDVVASYLTFDEYDAAITFSRFKNMPGERGGLFRDNPYGEELQEKLSKAEADGDKRCFIGARSEEIQPEPAQPEEKGDQ
ncbi:MAG: hypothetical protein L0Z68_10480 [Gammaproteobacteria bacterium]|nr:hypothetical protein [Gammaproteobacteria bacterium]